MKCHVCGSESGKYPLCRACNTKKDQGVIIKCSQCLHWHYATMPCPVFSETVEQSFLYSPKMKFISESEQDFYEAIQQSLPTSYFVFPQVNLATFIQRTDNPRFHNELFRNIDFLVTDGNYAPKIALEINDQSHLNQERRERDEKVKNILEEAGIPLIVLWTSYGANVEYIKARIDQAINTPIIRRKHFYNQASQETPYINQTPTVPNSFHTLGNAQPRTVKKGCYVATCVYNSYDCPQVWVLRRFRDNYLLKHFSGRLFVCFYYLISPWFVKRFGHICWIKNLWKKALDCLITNLKKCGYESTPYID